MGEKRESLPPPVTHQGVNLEAKPHVTFDDGLTIKGMSVRYGVPDLVIKKILSELIVPQEWILRLSTTWKGTPGKRIRYNPQILTLIEPKIQEHKNPRKLPTMAEIYKNATPIAPDGWLTAREVAEVLGISLMKANDLCYRGCVLKMQGETKRYKDRKNKRYQNHYAPAFIKRCKEYLEKQTFLATS